MSEIPVLVKDLTLILIVAGFVTLIFKRLKQPLVLGYIVAGFLVSPHMPYTMSVVNQNDVQTWANIGVMFTLFSLGLDFSFKKILKMGAAPFIATITILFCMMTLGMLVGHCFGWSKMNCIFLGGMLAMSSTTIIYKAFDDLGLGHQQFASLVMSVLILEDILAIVMMVMLAAIAGGGTAGGMMLLKSVGRIAFFLILWFVVGIFVIPLLLRYTRKYTNNETLLILALGLCCFMAVVSTLVGFSSAFGAFVMGSILAETIEADKIIKVVEPVKNLFGAIFFVSVGMLVDPKILVEYALPILALVAAILIGQALFGSLGFLVSGQSLKSAMRCGFSMAQIGEFSFIIATLGLSLGVIGHFLYPVVVAVSVITTFLTPYMMKAAVPCYEYCEKHMPKSWIRRLNHLTLSQPTTKGSEHKWRRLLMQMGAITVIYSILSAAITAVMLTFFQPFMRRLLPELWANLICGLVTVSLISPFLRAIVMKKNHSEDFKALWTESRVNRLPLLFTVFVRLAIAVGFVFYICNALTNFSKALIISICLVLVAMMILSRRLKRRSIRLERMFVLNLRSRDIEAEVHGHRRPLYEGRLLDRDIHIADFEVPLDSKWSGKTLKQLALGSQYGVLVSSILRANRRLNIPDGDSVIFPGDRLQVIGNDDQLAAFSSAMLSERYEDDYELEKREMKLRRMVISGSSPFVGKTMAECGIRHVYNCMVVGLEEGMENLSQVSPSYRFEKGDIIWVVGEVDDLKRLIG
ncbi:MAG: cation:proton antiporter [Prevotella sp.]|nr:cation:proton antiporter [Prevotella sp.]